MSQRTPNGAYVDAMLKAYRRTLQKTLEQARSMEQVVADPTVRLFADTPDKAVVWGFALGLHDAVSRVLRRNLEDQAATPSSTSNAYFPLWLGTSPSSFSGVGGDAGGSIFSGSGMPDVGGMFSAIGSIGSSPSSSSSGGGFGGGGSSGGGGGSGSF